MSTLTLQGVKAYMQGQSMVHMPALLQHFNTDHATLLPLLAHWERKGQLRACTPPGCGSRCVQCLPELRQAYQWCGTVAATAETAAQAA